jgi:SAM-dependent methyltransferase
MHWAGDERRFYECEYAMLYRDRVAEVGQQLRFLERQAGLSAGAWVLDLGCGYGRHAVALAAKGCVVVAMDYAFPLLLAAKERAIDCPGRQRLMLVCGDMTAMPLRRCANFNLALLLFATLGQFSADEALSLLREVRVRLRSGGRLVVDVLGKQWHATRAPHESWWSPPGAEGVEVHDTLTKYQDDGVIFVKRWVRTLGGERSYVLRQRLFTPEDLSQLLRDAGYVDIQLFGDWQSVPAETACYIVAVATA